MRGEARKQTSQPGLDTGTDDHPEDHGVKRKLNEHAAGGGHGVGNGTDKASWPPMQEQTGSDEDEVVSVEVEGGQCSLRRAAKQIDQVPGDKRADKHGQQRAVFQPLPGPGSRFIDAGDGLDADPEILGCAPVAADGAEK